MLVISFPIGNYEYFFLMINLEFLIYSDIYNDSIWFMLFCYLLLSSKHVMTSFAIINCILFLIPV